MAGMTAQPVLSHFFFQFGDKHQFQSKKAPDGLEGEIVTGGTEPACDDESVCGFKGCSDGGVEFFRVVSDGKDPGDDQTFFQKFFPEKSNIRIDGGTFQKFRSA